MLATPHDLSVADMKQWYVGTWVRVLGYSGPRYVHSVSDALATAHSGTGDGPSELAHDHTAISGHWPSLGAINLPEGFAMHIRRTPAKSYRRSFNLSVLTAVVPNQWSVGEFINAYRPTNITSMLEMQERETEIAKALWEPEYPTFSEAVNRLQTGAAISVALSRRVIITEAVKGEKLRVYHNGSAAGRSTMCGDFTPSASSPIDTLVLNSIVKRLRVC